MNNIQNNNQTIEKVEDKLRFLFKKKYVALCSRATVAIYATLLSINPKDYVIVPANICPSVINAIFQTGFQPIFVDLNLNNFNICLKSLKFILNKHKNISAVIVPHFYGIPAEIEELIHIVKNENDKILIIEDVAQSFGVKTDNLFVGSFGDVSIFSFGYSKIIDVSTGGAFITNNIELYKNIKYVISSLKLKNHNLLNLKEKYRTRYINILQNKNPDDDLLKIGSDFQDLFIHRCNSLFSKNLLKELNVFSENKSKRIFNYNEYKKNLRSNKFFLPDTDDGFIPWRFNFLSKKSKKITELLRDKRINVSNWYPPINVYYKKAEIKTDLTNSIMLGKEIVNLWVDKKTSTSDIVKTSKLINSII